MDMEDYLTGVAAMQIPADYEAEALKAQAIIARTYIRRQMEAAGTSEIAEAALDLDYPEEKQLKEMWGTAAFPAYFEKVEEAVRATEGRVLTYEGELIDPMFFRLSSGMTRSGDFLHPYFQNVDCPEDMEAADFEETRSFSYEEAAAAINSIPEGGYGPAADSAAGASGRNSDYIQGSGRICRGNTNRRLCIYRGGNPVRAWTFLLLLFCGSVGGGPSVHSKGKGAWIWPQPVHGK